MNTEPSALPALSQLRTAIKRALGEDHQSMPAAPDRSAGSSLVDACRRRWQAYVAEFNAQTELRAIETDTDLVNAQVENAYAWQRLLDARFAADLTAANQQAKLYTALRDSYLAAFKAQGEAVGVETETFLMTAQKDNTIARHNLLGVKYTAQVFAAELRVKLENALEHERLIRAALPWKDDGSTSALQHFLELAEQQRDLAQVAAQRRAYDMATVSPFMSADGDQDLLPGDQLQVARTADDLTDTAEFHYARLVRLSPERQQAELKRVLADLQTAGYTTNEIAFIQMAITEKLQRYG